MRESECERACVSVHRDAGCILVPEARLLGTHPPPLPVEHWGPMKRRRKPDSQRLGQRFCAVAAGGLTVGSEGKHGRLSLSPWCRAFSDLTQLQCPSSPITIYTPY